MHSRTALTAAASVALGAAALVFAPAAGAAPQSATPTCTAAQLTGSLGAGDVGAGQIYRDVVLTNHSSSTCHLTGYPGVSILNAHGAQIGAPAGHDPRSYGAVVLAPGATAITTIHTNNRMTNDPNECRAESASLRVYPPGDRASLVFPAKLTICDTFTVTPLVAGSGNPAPSASASAAPSTQPSAAPTTQVSAVPSGAPDTGQAPASSGGGSTGTLAMAGGALLVVGGAGAAVARGRRSRARG